ncbi:MAG: hypothetical protein QOE82_2170 [Thermoanaerobaculia bacterium]|jgi:hypothetical protein|nr:hypothetical protein [Thermoanaerobaculia bacterium]
MRLRYALALLVFPIVAFGQTPAPTADAPWHFVVAGDSRNCGDVVMPAIAQAAKNNDAKFYWHLGDWRAIYTFDEDMVQAAFVADPKKPLQIQNYLMNALGDAVDNQLKPFDKLGVPVYAGIGNHETIWPMTRAAFVKAFYTYLDGPAIRAQRLKDSPYDLSVHTYFHVVNNGIDFITMDNGSCDMFDETQMNWLIALLDRDAADASIKTVVLGAHAALPDSRSCGHSMGNYARQRETGRAVYRMLLEMRDKHHKQVYVLASHSHFVMDNVYDTPFWRANGGVLPGWIVGTSGAVRYRLPEGIAEGPNTKTDVYGYLLGTVAANGSITFDFHELKSTDVPPEVKTKYTEKWINDVCFAGNHDDRKQKGNCPPMTQCAEGD